MEKDLKNQLLMVIAERRPYAFLEVKKIYELAGSIDKCIQCIDDALKLGEDPRILAMRGDY